MPCHGQGHTTQGRTDDNTIQPRENKYSAQRYMSETDRATYTFDYDLLDKVCRKRRARLYRDRKPVRLAPVRAFFDYYTLFLVPVSPPTLPHPSSQSEVFSSEIHVGNGHGWFSYNKHVPRRPLPPALSRVAQFK